MSTLTTRIRAVLLVVAFAMTGWFALTPGMIRAQGDDDQDGWDECMFGENDPELGECDPNSEHMYEGSCEGVDCYSDLETCCQMAN